MCLARLTDFKVSKKHGWKVFFCLGGSLHGEFCGTNEERKVNRWLDSDDFLYDENREQLICDSTETYPVGWHIFLRKEDAKIWMKKSVFKKHLVIRKVLFKEIVAKGEQQFFCDKIILFKVVVAKKIKILPQKKKTKK